MNWNFYYFFVSLFHYVFGKSLPKFQIDIADYQIHKNFNKNIPILNIEGANIKKNLKSKCLSNYSNITHENK